MAGGPMDLWNHWAAQILVLLSLSLQVVLRLLAGIRRRKASPVLRFFLWLAYQLADSTAIYAIGYLSLTLSCKPREHQLMAFWASFLLLHLGGPDNITAYALEDNKLWPRHLVTLVVQVLGAGYVIYKHVVGSGILVLLAAVLMYIVGVVKYWERIWALWCANFSSIRSSLKVLPSRYMHHQYFYTEHQGHLRGAQDVDGEFLLQRAHFLFHICKRGIVDSVMIKADSDDTKEDDSDNPKEVYSDNSKEVASEDILDTEVIWDLMNNRKRMWTVMEMELSLMYDILYTKANVMHTFFGYCIRVVSPLAIVASLLLFLFSGKDGHSGVDVAISYVLLGGALVLETKSALCALGSSWALPFLCATWCWLRHAALCGGRWHRLRRVVLSLRRPAKIMPGSSRKWLGNMRQYNMLQVCTQQVDTTSCGLDNLAEVLGFSEWWDRWRYSWTIPIPEEVKERAREIHTMFSPKDLNTMGLLRHNWGELALDEKSRHGLCEKLKLWRAVDFHENIIIWHIATDLFLISRSRQAEAEDAALRVKAIRALSNYMMFLLVHRPYMLPGLPQNWLYEKTCHNLDELCKIHRERLPKDPSGRKKVLADIILGEEGKAYFSSFPKVPRLKYAREIANILLDTEDAVDVLFDLWTDFLAYAANRCSRESHAKRLSSGGELTTVVWLMIEHLCQIKSKATTRRSS